MKSFLFYLTLAGSWDCLTSAISSLLSLMGLGKITIGSFLTYFFISSSFLDGSSFFRI